MKSIRYIISRNLLFAGLVFTAGINGQSLPDSAECPSWKFDMGPGITEAGYTQVL
jgi:hypothetical protein